MIESPPKLDISPKAIELMQAEQKLIASINEEYLYWDKVKYKAVGDINPETLWSAVKASRLLARQTIDFGKYAFIYTPTLSVQRMLHNLDMNIGGVLGTHEIIPESHKNFYLQSSIMEEAFSSSYMEGATTTRPRAKDMLRKAIKPRDEAELMIANNYATINHIVEHKNDELTVAGLLNIHRLISAGTLKNHHDEGRFRDNDEVWVEDKIYHEIVHTPPRHDEIPGLIDDLIRFFNTDEGPFIHPIVKGVIIHFMIGWIHPFCDGNGRTARSLFYWYLLKKGYWMTEYLSISRIIKSSKTQYEKAYLYVEHDFNDLTYFVNYNLKATEKAFVALKEYIQRKQEEEKGLSKFMRLPNINERQARILKIIGDKSNSVLTVKEVENRFGVSNFTARTDLSGLVKLGFMEEIPVNKIKRHYIKSADFDRLSSEIK